MRYRLVMLIFGILSLLMGLAALLFALR